MKAVYHTACIGQFLFSGLLVGVPHVRTGVLDGGTPLDSTFLQPFQQGFLATVWQNIQNQPQFRSRDDQHKLALSTMERNLIETNRSHLWVPACLRRFFALYSKMPCTASSLRPSSWATWLTL